MFKLPFLKPDAKEISSSKDINLPDGCHALPDKTTTMEGTLPEETPHKEISMRPNLPVRVVELFPDESTNFPDDMNVLPDETTNLPDNVNVLPDKMTNLPDILNVAPDKMTNLPDEQNELPDKTTNLPDGKELLDGKDNASITSTETNSTKVKKYICPMVKDHAFWFLADKGDANWCKPNAMFGGVRCQGDSCGKIFVSKLVNKDTEFKPRFKKGIHVCANEKNKCTFAYCHDCYMKGMEVFFKDNK